MGLEEFGMWVGDTAKSAGRSPIVGASMSWLTENVWHMAIAAVVLHVVVIGE